MKKILITKGYIIEEKERCICGGSLEDNHAGSCDIERRQGIYHEYEDVKPIKDTMIIIEDGKAPNLEINQL